jgi:hypothetical protein
VSRPRTFRDAVAAYFHARPHHWIDGMEIASVGGCYAFRTRISEVRRDLGMTITNRQRKRPDGSTLSEYRYEPGPAQQELGL